MHRITQSIRILSQYHQEDSDPPGKSKEETKKIHPEKQTELEQSTAHNEEQEKEDNILTKGLLRM
jgi:hypothetical protein